MDIPASFAERIGRLEDIEAIRAMVATYALGADRNNDPAILGPLFAADAEWICEGFGHYRGRAEIADELARIGREGIRWSLHYMVSPLVELAADGHSAHCHWYLWELARVGDGTANWIGGWYESTLQKNDGKWGFSHVRLHLKLMSPHAEGWKTLPTAD